VLGTLAEAAPFQRTILETRSSQYRPAAQEGHLPVIRNPTHGRNRAKGGAPVLLPLVLLAVQSGLHTSNPETGDYL
jgi:hypothetical protein